MTRKKIRSSEISPVSTASRRPPGRPTAYTVELGEEICRRLAEGETLSAICRSTTMPSERTVRTWAIDPSHEFSPKYARAREIGYLKMADELLDIADEPVETAQDAARNRLRVDTRKWMLAKALPKIFGDKVSVGGADDPIKVEIQTKEVSDLELARWMINTMNRAAKTQTGAPSPTPLLEHPGDDAAD